jgi:GNAT superfamily N-acetyltransferase
VGAVVEWRFESLSRGHDRDSFACGEQELDEFLKKFALQNQEKGIGRTFVAVRPGQFHIVGYYTLSVACVNAATLSPTDRKRLPRYPLPVALLGRLAVDQVAQGQGLGQLLLMHALRNTHAASMRIGIHSIAVHALTEEAKQFYLRYGFREFLDDPLHLYLPLHEIPKMLPPN